MRLKSINILLIILLFTNLLFAQKPIWVKVLGDVNSESIKTNAPVTENEPVDLFIPKQTDHLEFEKTLSNGKGTLLVEFKLNKE